MGVHPRLLLLFPAWHANVEGRLSRATPTRGRGFLAGSQSRLDGAPGHGGLLYALGTLGTLVLAGLTGLLCLVSALRVRLDFSSTAFYGRDGPQAGVENM